MFKVFEKCRDGLHDVRGDESSNVVGGNAQDLERICRIVALVL